MKRASIKTKSNRSIDLLSRLLLTPSDSASGMAELQTDVVSLDKNKFDSLAALACTNHVIIRAIGTFRDIASKAKETPFESPGRKMRAIAAERSRIDNAIPFLDSICREFGNHRKPLAVIKSLDHWPDLGSDLDLYTDATPAEALALFEHPLHPKPQAGFGGNFFLQINF